ncbi:MAG: hypothetical protein ACI8RZ_002240 [Myxococcota bacterium]|jgi:hypothetical protein
MEIAEQWNRAVMDDPTPPEEFLEFVRAAGVVYGDRPLCVYRRPMFISHTIARRYLKLVSGLHRAIRVARQMIEEDGLHGHPDSLAVRMGVSPEALDLARPDPGYRSAAVLARLDSFLHNGQPRFVELNAESPAGMGYADALTDLFRHDRLLRNPRSVTSMRSAEAAARAIHSVWTANHSNPRPRIALVDFMDVPTRPEFLLMQQHFENIGQSCILADPRELDFDGRQLTHSGMPIDLVYRRLLVADVVKRPEACRALIEAYRAGKVMVVNSFRTSLLHGKGLFALLHDPALHARLPDSVIRVIKTSVPWTGMLTDTPSLGCPPDIRQTLLNEQNDWVIKPIQGHGGAGVVLGWQCDRRTWEAAVEHSHSHVAQRRVEVGWQQFPDAREDYALRQVHPSLDPFLIHGKLAGFLCRLTDGLGNVSVGASQVPVFIVED